MGFPHEEKDMKELLSGENPSLIELYPELATFRDVVFYFKAMMVPSGDALPEMRAWTPEDARLTWRYKGEDADEKTGKSRGKFTVGAFGKKELLCVGWLDGASADDDDVAPEKRLGFFQRLFGR
jgi:hypothetical protein